ncbi:MAG TPA: NAD(P)H-binding protein [Polyangiaceae bacterium]|nr:NAD(P)H-binding protein [Polyangiaceae bacterium]
MRVLVTGASGNVGREVVRALGARGMAARAAGRPGGDARGDGAPEAAPFDFFDRASFGPALRGCDGLFLLRPPAIRDVGPTLNALVDEAARRGVGHVVFLSVAGAGTNRFVPHHAVEARLRRGPTPFTIVRPGFFAQNLGDAYRRDVVDDGRLYVPAGRGAAAFVDVRDVAEVAALAFAGRSPRGTGLGLAVVRRLVDEHGGAVAVKSAPGRTLFTVRLPRSPLAGPASSAGRDGAAPPVC